jgi:hypothetical protein
MQERPVPPSLSAVPSASGDRARQGRTIAFGSSLLLRSYAGCVAGGWQARHPKLIVTSNRSEREVLACGHS